MAILVSLVGLAVVLVGILGMVNPQQLADTVRAWPARGRFLTVVGGRLVAGITFIFVAPATKFPTAIRVLGALAVVAAVVLILVGTKRVDALLQWWFRRSPSFTRGWSVLAVLFGGVLVYAGT